MRASWVLVVGLALGASACLRGTEYRCSSNTACGTGGTCESVGFCSFPDGSCPSGERFADSAGSLANQCTGTAGADGGTDGPPIDAPTIDAPSAGCPGTYATIPGGQGTHRYLVLSSGNWNQLGSQCLATTPAAYLAIPDDAGELAALAAVAGQGQFWVGITDSGSEGSWRTTKGAAQTFLPWDNGSPDMSSNNQDDCVKAVSPTQIRDERCNQGLVGVCECEP